MEGGHCRGKCQISAYWDQDAPSVKGQHPGPFMSKLWINMTENRRETLPDKMEFLR